MTLFIVGHTQVEVDTSWEYMGAGKKYFKIDNKEGRRIEESGEQFFKCTEYCEATATNGRSLRWSPT